MPGSYFLFYAKQKSNTLMPSKSVDSMESIPKISPRNGPNSLRNPRGLSGTPPAKLIQKPTAQQNPKTIVSQVLPWEQVQEAHRYREENRNMGKIILQITANR
ncbi:MAG: zinc-binding dehydrogenase [bacterium]|nr:zinc-binding dehydrogenase [bacterium]